jgi:hypothetical protein
MRANSPASAGTACAGLRCRGRACEGGRRGRFLPAECEPRAGRGGGGCGIAHIIGTTGFSEDDEAKIKAAAAKTVIVKSGNMSLGVNLLAALVKRVAKTLDDEFDIEIVEMHHNRKIDAPSGTALLLGRAAADGRGVDLGQRSVMAARAIPARASRATSALPPCAAARWLASIV